MDENEVTAGPEALDYKTADIGAILAGIVYPKEVVSVYMDESIGYLITRTNSELQRLADAGKTEEYNELEESFHKMLKEANSKRVEVHLTGVDRKTRKDVLTSVTAEFPAKTDVFGRIEPNLAADEAYANKIWAVHIEKMVTADGRVVAPILPEDVQLFRDKAPAFAQETIEAAINELSEGSKAGFELAAQEQAFLSTP